MRPRKTGDPEEFPTVLGFEEEARRLSPEDDFLGFKP